MRRLAAERLAAERLAAERLAAGVQGFKVRAAAPIRLHRAFHPALGALTSLRTCGCLARMEVEGRRGTPPSRLLTDPERPSLSRPQRLGVGERRWVRARGMPTMLPRSSPRLRNQSPTSRKDSPLDSRGPAPNGLDPAGPAVPLELAGPAKVEPPLCVAAPLALRAAASPGYMAGLQAVAAWRRRG